VSIMWYVSVQARGVYEGENAIVNRHCTHGFDSSDLLRKNIGHSACDSGIWLVLETASGIAFPWASFDMVATTILKGCIDGTVRRLGELVVVVKAAVRPTWWDNYEVVDRGFLRETLKEAFPPRCFLHNLSTKGFVQGEVRACTLKSKMYINTFVHVESLISGSVQYRIVLYVCTLHWKVR
jgi:hypothetical protein